MKSKKCYKEKYCHPKSVTEEKTQSKRVTREITAVQKMLLRKKTSVQNFLWTFEVGHFELAAGCVIYFDIIISCLSRGQDD